MSFLSYLLFKKIMNFLNCYLQGCPDNQIWNSNFETIQEKDIPGRGNSKCKGHGGENGLGVLEGQQECQRGRSTVSKGENDRR